MRLKILIGYVVAVVLGTMFTAQAFAQYVPPKAERELQNWMARDPRLAEDPDLMLNPEYQRNHPNFATWLRNHPRAHEQIVWMGAYDEGHHWHDTDWWRHNNPDWIYRNHPEWIDHHPEWRADGDWDEGHHWHDRGWWAANHGDWVTAHHPEWAEAHGLHHEAAIEHHEEHMEHHEAAIEHHEAGIEHHEQHMEHHEEHMEHHDHDHH
jgi:hypothetical protein